MIQTRDLTRRFGQFPAVDNLTLTVPAGVFFGFLGPNGAGKTTTMLADCRAASWLFNETPGLPWLLILAQGLFAALGFRWWRAAIRRLEILELPS